MGYFCYHKHNIVISDKEEPAIEIYPEFHKHWIKIISTEKTAGEN